MDAVFLDTNCIRNSDTNTFFGQIGKLKQISNVAQIYVPHIVMEEIKIQKKNRLTSSLGTFKDNYFAILQGFDVRALRQHIEDKIQELYDNAINEVDFIEHHLENDLGHVDTLKKLALSGTAPFESRSKGSSPNNDKGFKDGCIYLSILQYLEKNKSDEVFLISNDTRLGEAFNDCERVTVVKAFEGYFSHRASYFEGKYFIEKLCEYFDDATIEVQHISDIDLNEDDDWQMVVSTVDKDSLAYMEECTDEDGNPSVQTVLPRVNHQILADFYSKEIISDEKL